ncbi:MAG TPA: AzlC family ABC transporter permease [Nocardioidaceae bacterium]|nr:AzlC family ABC transporter permease [Nocardioidaceae bacterium]
MIPAGSRIAFVDGMRLGLGAAAPVFVLAVTFGAAAVSNGWGTALPVLFSMAAFSGSAQFTLLASLSSGSALAAVSAATLINARYLVMSVAVNDSLTGGRLRRMLQAQTLVDASFVIAHRGDGRFDVASLIGASVPQWLAWVSGTAIGAVAAPSADLVQTLGVDAAFPAFFLLLAVDELRTSARARLATAVGATIAGGLLFVTTPANALLAAVAGAAVGLAPTPRRPWRSRTR